MPCHNKVCYCTGECQTNDQQLDFWGEDSIFDDQYWQLIPSVFTAEEEGMRTFKSGANRSPLGDKLQYEGFISPHVLRRYAQYMHKHRVCEDGSLRAPDNWQNGIPDTAYADSLIRHVMDLWIRIRDENVVEEEYEDLLCAVMFNTMGLLFNSLMGVEWD